MNPLFVAAADIHAFCSERGWRYCIIGGLAAARWGEPRQTVDVDLSIFTGLGGEEQFIKPLLDHYRPRTPDARRFALENRVLLMETANGISVDVALAGLPFEERVIARSTIYDAAAGQRFITCSAEDLVVLKAFAGRGRDWADIEGVLARQGLGLDRGLIMDELRPLLELREDQVDSERTLQQLFAKHLR